VKHMKEKQSIQYSYTDMHNARLAVQSHRLYVNLAVRHDYLSPAARALRQPRRAPRVLIITLSAAAICLDSAARPGASARRAARHAARHAARRRLLSRASGCLGTSRGSSRGSSCRSSSTTPPRAGSSSTTSPPPRVRAPRHVARLVTLLVVDYSTSRRLVVDYFASAARVRVPWHVARLVTRLVVPLVLDYSASRRLVVDYFTSATRPGALARRVARHAARRAARRRLLRLAQARRRLLRLRRASGCLGTSRGSSRGSSRR
jgi:hypothetical protein